MITQEMKAMGICCKGKGLLCGQCKDAEKCTTYEPIAKPESLITSEVLNECLRELA